MKKLLLLLALVSVNVFATPVNVNTADAKTLAASLTGIGIKKADAIVADRAKNGAFKNADDLKRVSGIGEKIVAANRADILVSDTKTAAPEAAKPGVTQAPATPAATTPPIKK